MCFGYCDGYSMHKPAQGCISANWVSTWESMCSLVFNKVWLVTKLHFICATCSYNIQNEWILWRQTSYYHHKKKPLIENLKKKLMNR